MGLEKHAARRRPARRMRRGEDAAARSGRGWDLVRPEWSIARGGGSRVLDEAGAEGVLGGARHPFDKMPQRADDDDAWKVTVLQFASSLRPIHPTAHVHLSSFTRTPCGPVHLQQAIG